MVKRITKTLSLLLVMSMVALCGCGQKEQKESSESQAKQSEVVQSQSSEESVETVVNEEPVHLTIGITQDPKIIDFDTNYYVNLLEERCNVDLEAVIFPANAQEFRQKLSLMVTGNQELPDLILINLEDAETELYGKNGVFLPLTEYFNDADAMPTFYENVPEEDRELMIQKSIQLNGEIYGAPSYYPELGNEYPYRAWINTTWLEELGLPMPSTTEEFYNTLKAFKEKDPNKNGKADEIPMVGSLGGWNHRPELFLMNAFTYCDSPSKYFAVEDGKVYAAYATDEWKAGLEYMHKLVSEDLLTSVSFTQDSAQLKAILANEEAQIVGCFVAGSMSVYTADSVRNDDMDVLPPLTGPDGACYATYTPATVDTNTFMITKYCDDVDAAVRLMDAFYDEELCAIARLGEPEVDWTTDVGDAISPYTDSMGIETGYVEINSIWSTEQNKHLNAKAVRYMNPMSPLSIQGKGIDANTDPKNASIMTPKALPYYMDKHPEENAYKLRYTEDEQILFNEFDATVRTYAQECFIQFIVGEKKLSEWDGYLKELDKMGLEEFTKLVQTAFDRQNGK